MEVKLYQMKYKVGPSGDFRPVWEEADYTGRWRIVRHNEKSTLYLECFEIVPKYVDAYEKKSYLFGLFERTYYVGRKESGIKAKVYWVSEERLNVTTQGIYINQCGGMYG